MDMKKQDRLILTITGLTSRGQGVGRYQGMVVFVPHAVPGDEVEVEIVNVQKSHCFGLVKTIITPSPHRVENKCPVFPRCGGCTLRYLSYEEECRQKETMIRENLERIGGISLELEEFLPSPQEERYRNKAQYPIQEQGGKIVYGFYAPRSHDLIPLEDCLLQPEIFSRIAHRFCQLAEEYGLSAYQEGQHRGLLRHLLLRSNVQGEVLVTVVAHREKGEDQLADLLTQLTQEFPEIVSTTINWNVKKTNVILGQQDQVITGDGILVDHLAGVQLELSPQSFYQVNQPAAERLSQKVKEYAQPSKEDVLLDLYCGIGSIGLSMAKDVETLIGVEIVLPAVKNARKNAELNHSSNARFIHGDAGTAAKELLEQGITPTLIVVDPPRKGLEEQTISAIGTLAPRRVVYVSCNSATLARDCKALADFGYEVTRGTGVDLFPRTAHVESVVLLSQTKS